VRRQEVHRELEAQIVRVISTGRRPSHLDSHQHVHLLPPVWAVTRELATQYGIRWIRIPHFDSLIGFESNLSLPIFRLGLNVLSTARRGLSGPREQIRTIGVHLSGRLNEPDLCRLITRLHTGVSELVTHPGVMTMALRERYRWNYEWSMELAALLSSRIASVLHSSGVSLTRFSDPHPSA
jgi:predicted glycoside hydrolase/deacetylase ChbG (UPF0249 family)